MKYLLDTSVFLEAYRRLYAMDICPGFWDWLDSSHKAGLVVSLDKVRDELNREDDLRKWAEGRSNGWFLPGNDEMSSCFSTISTWVHNKTFNNGVDYYELRAKNKFFSDADYYLIAYAMGNKLTLVTQEIKKSGPSEVKIPTVCEGKDINVTCINMYQMLRNEKFVLRMCKDSKCNSACH